MKSRDDILLFIKEIMLEMFEIEEHMVTPDARLNEDLDFDSIDAVDMIVKLKEITGKAVVADEFITDEMNLVGQYSTAEELGEDKADYFVPLRWIKAVEESEAFNEVGLFGNQNTIAQPRAEKWEHTVKQLKGKWVVE